MSALDRIIEQHNRNCIICLEPDSECEFSIVARAELTALRASAVALSNLLAVIHRDGGQHEAQHGAVESAKAAE